jgi:methionyl-tRNA formyltransferase
MSTRVVFMGTPGFALPSLEALVKSERKVVAVVTQPDRPKGRGQKLAPPPVKTVAEHSGIPVHQPENLRDRAVIDLLTSLQPDYIIVVAYGKILPPDVLQIPKKGCINLHASLLPKYRGASPVQWAIMNGEKITGLTTMRMDAGMDTGDILLQTKVRIDPDDTAGVLSDRLAWVGSGLLIKTLDELDQGSLVPTPQAEAEATTIPPLKKEDGLISWIEPAEKIHNRIRAMDPRPGAYTYYKGMKWGVWKSEWVEKPYAGRQPGEIVDVKNDYFVVATGHGGIRIREIQPEGKRRMTVTEYLRGNQVEKGVVLQSRDGSQEEKNR